MSLTFQKRSALKLVERTIPHSGGRNARGFFWGKMDKRIGTITIVITDRAKQAQKVNQILCDFGELIIGRMGLPYAPANLHIIALIVHASTDAIGSLTGKLGALPGVSVKACLTKV